jgi:PTH1 family peptidyl-tRNA hydrolase
VKLVIGLGNPGDLYRTSRHNAGRILVENIHRLDGFTFLTTDTYMNDSGTFVRKAMKEYGASLEDLIVVHDDWVFEVGDFKVQYGRGANGHNGIGDIINRLGSKSFWRVRIGVGPKPDDIDGADFVLGSFTDTEYQELLFLVKPIKEKLLAI